MLFTALRISETVALDVEDVRIMTRRGVLAVAGKGEIQREVPLNALVRQVLDEWLEQRNVLAGEGAHINTLGRYELNRQPPPAGRLRPLRLVEDIDRARPRPPLGVSGDKH